MAMGAIWMIFGLIVVLGPLFGSKPFLLPGLNLSVGWLIMGIGIARIFIGWRMEQQRQKTLELRRLRREKDQAAAKIRDTQDS